MKTRTLTAVCALLVTILVTGCSPSLGETKTSADAEIAAMSGLSEEEIGQFRWRIESAGEKETVERIAAEAEAANQQALGQAAEREAMALGALEPWLSVPLVVTWPPQGHQGLTGEVLTLHPSGEVETTAGLAAEWDHPATWVLVDHPAATWIEICGDQCWTWVVKDMGAGQVELVAPVQNIPTEREGERWLFEREGASSGS